ncbi:MAG TPA: type III-B CRISPR module RAMP protein Cmr6 [Ktedonobacteraceae bacterium]|nr:type III-B CRISPR module RAMP protein Cmr6 [Ktedonobacteraceae bacterium]
MIHPTEIRKKLPDHVRIEQEAHAGLWLDKYFANQGSEQGKNRHKLIEEVSVLPIPTAYRAYFKRWEGKLTEYGAQFRKTRVKGRMVVGLGSESIVETSISLHRTYGVPYIPGSALKGLAANYAQLYLDADWQKSGKYYKVVFGNTDDSGYITFFDALYVPGSGHPNSNRKEQVLYPDVITVHHPEYYQGTKKTPSDSDSPNPVPFLSATGTYLIALAAPDLEEPEGWISTTFSVLENALKMLGVGAKTSSGYGRMELELPLVKQEDIYTTQTDVPPLPKPYQGPAIPDFREGQELQNCTVISPTGRMQQLFPSASAYLRYQEFPTRAIFVAIEEDITEARDWKPPESRGCVILRVEPHEDCLVLVCKPRQKKNKKNKEKK